MESPHTSHDLAQKIFALLLDWRIDRKVFSITLGNVSANEVLQKNLCEELKLQNSLICNGDYFHVRCSVHVLNIIVQEGLRVTSDALHKIRESIKFI